MSARAAMLLLAMLAGAVLGCIGNAAPDCPQHADCNACVMEDACSWCFETNACVTDDTTCPGDRAQTPDQCGQ